MDEAQPRVVTALSTARDPSGGYKVWCSCGSHLIPTLPWSDRPYFRECPRSTCERYWRILVVDGESLGSLEARAWPARRWYRVEEGLYRSEDGGIIQREKNYWRADHPKLNEPITDIHFTQLRIKVDNQVA